MTVASITAAQPQVVSGASAKMPPQQKMANLFNNIDSAQTGSISQAQFNQAFQSMNPPAVFKTQGASAIWSKLDPNGTGSVSKSDFVSTMKGLMVSLRSAPSQTIAASTNALSNLKA